MHLYHGKVSQSMRQKINPKQKTENNNVKDSKLEWPQSYKNIVTRGKVYFML